MASTKKGFTEGLVEYVSNLRYDELPAEVIQQSKKVILDGLGCQVACAQRDNGALIVQIGRTLGGQEEASVTGGNYKTSAINAALVNGTLGHGDEIDSSLEEAGHVGAVVVPVALACGERTKASGKDMIVAVVAGYEVAGRLANAGVTHSHFPMGLVDGSAGIFCAVAAACNILKLTTNEARIAFGLAACQQGGFYDLGSEAKHMAKSLMYGLIARNSVTAALLAQMGYEGPQSVFDGDNNVFSFVIGQNFDREELVKNLGKKFVIMDMGFKLYSAGHPIHAPVDGLLRILAREGISAEDVQSILVRQPERENRTVSKRDMPDINIQYCMAVAAFDRQLTWDQYTPERLNDPNVQSLKSRVVAVSDPRLDERAKITKAHSAEVELQTRDGREFFERVDYPPGDPGNPASQEALDNKIMYYASKVLGRDKTQNLMDAVKKLETVSDLNHLGDLLRT